MKATKQRMRMEIKEISAEGSFEGVLSPYNVIDLGKDLVEPGAYTKTIQEHGSEVPMLWQHKTDVPIGKLTLIDGPDALRVKGQLLMSLPEAQKAYLLIKAQIVKGLSIGYDTVKDAVEGGVRHLKELRLWEGSIVTFPMSLSALITSVKARGETKEDFNTELAEVQLQDMGYQIFSALRSALGSLPWASGMTRDEKVAAAEVTLQQFSDAFLAYLPAYIDWLAEEYGDMETMAARKRETKDGFESRFDGYVRLLKAGAVSRKEVRALELSIQLKSGRTISAATKTTLTQAHDHVKSATDLLFALISDEADCDPDVDPECDADTSSQKAANLKTEPDEDHSAAQILVEEIRSFLSAA